jgi:hypothetical protein
MIDGSIELLDIFSGGQQVSMELSLLSTDNFLMVTFSEHFSFLTKTNL